MNTANQNWPRKSPLGPGSATEVVLAASDSMGTADYKCSGNNDQFVVQQAINVAAAAGKKLRVKAGHYKLAPQGDYILQLVDNTIMEADKGAIFQKVTDVGFTANANPNFFSSNGFAWWPLTSANYIRNVQIYNLTIDMGTTPHLKLNAADWGHPKGFYDYRVIRGTIKGLTLGEVTVMCPDPAVIHYVRFFLWHCSNVLLQQCSFDGIESWVFTYDPNDPWNYSKWDGDYFEVDSCVFKNGYAGMNIGGGMKHYYAHHNKLYQTNYSLPASAIDMFMSPGGRAEYNEVYNTGNYGIYGEGGNDQVFANNYVEGARAGNDAGPVPGGWGGWGILVCDQKYKGRGTNVQIHDNHIKNCSQGIQVEGYGSRATGDNGGPKVFNNVIEDMDLHGIVFVPRQDSGYPLATADYGLVAGNQILGFGKLPGHTSRGIMLSQVSHADVGPNAAGGANTVDGKEYTGALEGISEVTGSSAPTDNNHIHGNIVKGCKTPYMKKGLHSVFE